MDIPLADSGNTMPRRRRSDFGCQRQLNVRRAMWRANHTDEQKDTENDNSRIGMSEFCSRVIENEVDMLRIERVHTQRWIYWVMLCWRKIKISTNGPTPDPLWLVVSWMGGDSKHFLANVASWKIITDNSVETIVSGNTEINNDSLDVV